MDNMEKTERVGAGIFGAFLFALAGGIVWVVLYQLGYLAALSGLVGVICAMKGYSLFAKKESVKGMVIAIIATLVVMVIAWYVALVIAVYREFDGLVTFSQTFQLVWEAMKYPDVRSDAIVDLVKGLLFSVGGGVAFAVSSIKRVKAQKEYEEKVARETQPVFNGEPEYRYDEDTTGINN